MWTFPWRNFDFTAIPSEYTLGKIALEAWTEKYSNFHAQWERALAEADNATDRKERIVMVYDQIIRDDMDCQWEITEGAAHRARMRQCKQLRFNQEIREYQARVKHDMVSVYLEKLMQRSHELHVRQLQLHGDIVQNQGLIDQTICGASLGISIPAGVTGACQNINNNVFQQSTAVEDEPLYEGQRQLHDDIALAQSQRHQATIRSKTAGRDSDAESMSTEIDQDIENASQESTVVEYEESIQPGDSDTESESAKMGQGIDIVSQEPTAVEDDNMFMKNIIVPYRLRETSLDDESHKRNVEAGMFPAIDKKEKFHISARHECDQDEHVHDLCHDDECWLVPRVPGTIRDRQRRMAFNQAKDTVPRDVMIARVPSQHEKDVDEARKQRPSEIHTHFNRFQNLSSTDSAHENYQLKAEEEKLVDEEKPADKQNPAEEEKSADEKMPTEEDSTESTPGKTSTRIYKLKRCHAQISGKFLADSLDLYSKRSEARVSDKPIFNEIRIQSSAKDKSMNDVIETPNEVNTSSKKSKRRTRRLKEKLARVRADAGVFIEPNSSHESEVGGNGSPSKPSWTRSTRRDRKEKMARARADSGVFMGTHLDLKQPQVENNEEPGPSILTRELPTRRDYEYMSGEDNKYAVLIDLEESEPEFEVTEGTEGDDGGNDEQKPCPNCVFLPMYEKCCAVHSKDVENVQDIHPQRGVPFSFCGI